MVFEFGRMPSPAESLESPADGSLPGRFEFPSRQDCPQPALDGCWRALIGGSVETTVEAFKALPRRFNEAASDSESSAYYKSPKSCRALNH